MEDVVSVCGFVSELVKRLQMGLKKKIWLIMVVLLLNSSVLCFEAVHKGNSGQSGRFIIGSNTTTNTPKDGVFLKMHDEHATHVNGYQSDQLALIGRNVIQHLYNVMF